MENITNQDLSDNSSLEFSVYLSPDRTEVLLDCPDPLSNIDLIVTDILQGFESLELPETPPKDSLRKIILDGGHRLRVYVPFGRDWYPYSMRRLRENPTIAKNVLFAMVNAKDH